MDNERIKAYITGLGIFSISMLLLSFFSNPYASIVDIVFRAIVGGIISIFIVSMPFALLVWKGYRANKREQSDNHEGH